jgi:ketosteroid isomerase-like protein
MKTIFPLLMLALLAACTTTPAPDPVDLAAEEVAISEVFDLLFNAVDEKNIEQLASVLADDGMFMGTDPRELFPKDSIVAAWRQMMQMPEIPPFDFLSDPYIRIHPDGKTAVAAYQYTWNLFSPIPMRQTFWMVKSETGWQVDFFDFSFVPYNDQIPLLNKAVMGNME